MIDTAKRLLASRAGGYSRAGFMVIAIRIGGAGLGLVAQVLAARHIGAEAFGYYALALVWLLLLGHGATAGTNQLICRLLASYRVENNPAAAHGLLRFSLMLAGGVALALALGAIALVRTGVLGLDPQVIGLWTLAFAVIPLIVTQDFLEAIARGLDKPTLGIAPAMLLRHLAIIVGVGALMISGQHGDAITVMGFTVAGLIASTAIQFFLIRSSVTQLIGDAKPHYQNWFWFKTAMPIAVLDASDVLFNNADILVLGMFAPPEIVAYYFAATRLAQILGYVPYGITAATAQKYSALAARQDRVGLQKLISSVAVTGTAVTTLAALVLWALAAPLLSLFGADYQAAALVVPILCCGLIAVCAFGPGEDVLTMLGEERVCSAVFAFVLIANLGLNFLLIPLWGMIGAAVATSTALALRGALLAWFAHKRLGLALPIFVPLRDHAQVAQP